MLWKRKKMPVTRTKLSPFPTMFSTLPKINLNFFGHTFFFFFCRLQVLLIWTGLRI